MFRTILLTTAFALTAAVAHAQHSEDTLPAGTTDTTAAGQPLADAPTGERNPSGDTLPASATDGSAPGQPQADAPTGERNPSSDTLPASETDG